ncbi:hypothetical protein [Ponticoccus litoralis]|uniref:Uncharacterized protein n=1 Tax=Ponticoccus litoralis TaxID=422297 RepID=A0AAW9SV95_9RHOB
MSNIETIRELLALWPSRRDIVAELAMVHPGLNVTLHRVNKWAETGSIPAKYHLALIRSAKRRSLPVTAELLVKLHAPAEGSGGLLQAQAGDAA